MRKVSAASIMLFMTTFLLFSPVANASLIINSTGSDSATDYGAVFFAGVTVNVGDFLVVSHSNNKRGNGSNVISIAGAGANSFTALSAGDTGSGQEAWLFYSQIGSAGTFDLTLDTSNATKTVSQASTYWVVSADSGEVVSLAASDTSVTADDTSLNLDFSFASPLSNGMGFGAGTTGDALTLASGWTSPLTNGSGKRNTLFNSSVSGSSLTSTFSVTTSSQIALSGIVLTANAVPEPSSAIVFAVGVGLVAVRRRKK